MHGVGAELHGAKSEQSGWRHGHHQRQGEDCGVGVAAGVAAEAAESAEVARCNHGRDFIHFAGRTKARFNEATKQNQNKLSTYV